jgi:hypothetical protein
MANPYRNTGKAGSPAHFLQHIPKVVKAGKNIIKAFSNTAKQYFRGGKTAEKDIRPLIINNKIYNRKEIDKAFKRGLKPEATLAPKMPKIENRTMHTNIFGTKFIGKDVTPPNTNFGRPDAVVKMRTSMNKSGQYPKSDPFRGSPDLR